MYRDCTPAKAKAITKHVWVLNRNRGNLLFIASMIRSKILFSSLPILLAFIVTINCCLSKYEVHLARISLKLLHCYDDKKRTRTWTLETCWYRKCGHTLGNSNGAKSTLAVLFYTISVNLSRKLVSVSFSGSRYIDNCNSSIGVPFCLKQGPVNWCHLISLLLTKVNPLSAILDFLNNDVKAKSDHEKAGFCIHFARKFPYNFHCIEFIAGLMGSMDLKPFPTEL